MGLHQRSVRHRDEAAPAFLGGSLWVACLRGQRLYQVPRGGDGAVGDPAALRRAVRTAADGRRGTERDAVVVSNRDGRGRPRDGDDRILQLTPTPPPTDCRPLDGWGAQCP
jgi:hypothetical protein